MREYPMTELDTWCQLRKVRGLVAFTNLYTQQPNDELQVSRDNKEEPSPSFPLLGSLSLTRK
jgi:hypothetical protein